MHSALRRRLSPLYAFSFFQGLIFWYAIERVFMVRIGFSPDTIVLVVVLLSLVGLVLDVPSGILADRKSRKAVLLAAVTALGLSSLLMGLSRSVPEYVAASLLFAVYFALHAGVFDSMLYDTVVEESGERAGYEWFLGRAGLYTSVANVLGSLLGGVIGSSVSLPAAYFLSVPGTLLATIALLAFREPKLHRQQVDTHVWRHVRQTLGAVLRGSATRQALVVVLLLAVVYEFMLEVDQLWPLALHLHTAWYGPLNAFLLLGYGVGGPLAAFLMHRRAYLYMASAVGLAAVLALTVRNIFAVAAAQFGVLCLFVALYTLALGRLHDSTPSNIRSGVSSAASMFTGVVFTPLVLVFGIVAQHHSVFAAAWMLVPLAVLGVFGVIALSKDISAPQPHGPTPRPEALPNPTVPQ